MEENTLNESKKIIKTVAIVVGANLQNKMIFFVLFSKFFVNSLRNFLISFKFVGFKTKRLTK
ncbi:hypothetical protein LMA_08578 [Liquorilactobacillus mali KCTC 3596 = DSM 20444]|nr:hypothetical protein LMA_08578 [Liquorilactobacillus mali KCTC 3596 = DSM 20444]